MPVAVCILSGCLNVVVNDLLRMIAGFGTKSHAGAWFEYIDIQINYE